METRIVFYISFAAAFIAFVCALFMGFCLLLAGPGINLQPSHPLGTVTDFIRRDADPGIAEADDARERMAGLKGT